MHYARQSFYWVAAVGVVEQLAVQAVREGVKVLPTVEAADISDRLVVVQEVIDMRLQGSIVENMLLNFWVEVPFFAPVRSDKD